MDPQQALRWLRMLDTIRLQIHAGLRRVAEEAGPGTPDYHKLANLEDHAEEMATEILEEAEKAVEECGLLEEPNA